MKELRSLISHFGQISGYKINESKSIIVVVNVAEQEYQRLMDGTSAKSQEDNSQYLGIKPDRTNEKMIQENIETIINYLRERCHAWEKFKLSWLGSMVHIWWMCLLIQHFVLKFIMK